MVSIRPSHNEHAAVLKLRCALDTESRFMLAESGERAGTPVRSSYRLVAEDAGTLVGVIDIHVLPWRSVRGARAHRARRARLASAEFERHP